MFKVFIEKICCNGNNATLDYNAGNLRIVQKYLYKKCFKEYNQEANSQKYTCNSKHRGFLFPGIVASTCYCAGCCDSPRR